MPGSWRSSAPATVALVLAVLATADVSAHRRDEYLQAARIGIEPEIIQVDLDLTPGIDVAATLIDEIDADRSGEISDEDARAYAVGVLENLRLDLDGRPLRLELDSLQAPRVEAVRNGEGAIRLRWIARLPEVTDGAHALSFRNGHRPDISVYLANALVPASTRVAITGQSRDVAQREIRVDFTLGSEAASPWSRRWRWGGALVLAATGAGWWQRARRRGRSDAAAATARRLQ